MPDEIEYDESKHRLLVGKGFIDNVPAAVWDYEVSGKRVLTQWFSDRKRNRERPIPAQSQLLEAICEGPTLNFSG
jgi:hypothetical protein